MMVHVFQVHKQQIDKVPHAKEGRDSFHIDIFGMSNIPKEVIDEKHAERGIPFYYLGIFHFHFHFHYFFVCFFFVVVIISKQ